MFIKLIGFVLSASLILWGCATPPTTSGSLGYEDSRRLVIIGENVDPNIASYYQKKYGALVWFTPYEGRFAKNANNFLQSGLGPSVGMRSLIKELKSMNYSVGQWEIIIPGVAEKYFLTALKNMKSHSLSKARGIVILIDSASRPEIEVQLKRVTDDNFFVSYKFNEKSAPGGN